MEELSTQQQNLVRFLYNETTLAEEFSFQRELSFDFELREEFEMLNEAKQALPKALFNPSSSVLDNILKYSRATAAEHHC